ncbi:unnamed protein product, partial [marine sediment metagenome]
IVLNGNGKAMESVVSPLTFREKVIKRSINDIMIIVRLKQIS